MTSHSRDDTISAIYKLCASTARTRRTITYKRIGELVGLHHRHVSRYLYPIQDACKAKGLPPLTAVVVRESDGKAGDGLERRDGAALADVYAYRWPHTWDAL
jgi:putative restriction endonuclease